MELIREPFNDTVFNVGNSIFPGYNDKNGILICGYEYGRSKHDEFLEKECRHLVDEQMSKINTFYNKS
jgi:hypothetical protein